MCVKLKQTLSSPPVRLITTLLLVLLEICITFFLVFKMTDITIWIYVLFQIINFIVVFQIVNKRSNPSYKIMWIIFILSIPPVGGVIYLLWGSGRVTPAFRKRMTKINKSFSKFLEQSEAIENRLEYNDMQHARQSKYLYNQSGYPVWDNTETEYLSPGEVALPRLLAELENAKKFIFIEFFILAEGKMWNQIYSILKRKAAEGVEIRIIYDDFGSIMRQSRNFAKRLRKSGIKVLAFNPVRPSVDIFQNNRNHRKIVIIDGVVSFTGGLNIGDEYINETHPHGYWMDCGVLLKGPATRNFTVMFCEMWNTIDIKHPIYPSHYIPKTFDSYGDGFVQPYCSSPVDPRNPAEGLYMQILYTAKKYVYIASPYLILDNSMTQILKATAQSGIDVRIITPKKEDKWYVHPVTQSNYEELLEAGVRIYEFTPGFIHSKLFVSDDKVATVGTVNMDYRSFYMHFECGTWIASSKTVLDIKKHFIRILEDCKEITLQEWRKRPTLMKIKQAVLRVFAPFM